MTKLQRAALVGVTAFVLALAGSGCDFSDNFTEGELASNECQRIDQELSTFELQADGQGYDYTCEDKEEDE